MNKDNIKRIETDINNFLNYQVTRCEDPNEVQEMDQMISIVTMQWAMKTLNKYFTLKEIATLFTEDGKDT